MRALGLPSAIRACLFDLDGVLTDTAALHARAWKQVFDELLEARCGPGFVPFDAVREYRLHVDGRRRRDGARAFLATRRIELSLAELDALVEEKDSLVLGALRREGVGCYEESVAYVRAVQAAGLRCAVVSASRHCAEVLRAARIDGLFELCVDGVMAARKGLAGKPAPDTFLAAARELSVEPAAAAVFEDALSGVAAGRAGGFGLVVGVDRIGDAAALLAHGADVVVCELGELLGPPSPRTANDRHRPAAARHSWE